MLGNRLDFGLTAVIRAVLAKRAALTPAGSTGCNLV